MNKILCSLIIFILLSTTLMAQTEEQQVAAAVETLRKAMIDADKTTLEKIAADQISYGHSSGLIENKAAFVQNIVSGNSDFVTIDLSEQTISIAGDVALVRHKLVAETNNNGQPGKANIGVLLVWKKQARQWRLLARQAFKL
ncbi:MAG TPA: nuclear transport factor 2 family protein [Ohtaekwangia sp.]